MNSRLARVVQVAVLMSGSTLAGCVNVDGGAVELSWALRTANGKDNVECTRAGDVIADVALCARACTVISDGACIGDVAMVHSWSCNRRHGSTSFEIVSGRKELWIEVRCASGARADVVVPEPILRDIADGEVTQLNAVLISVPVDRPACPDPGAAATSPCVR
jgi:hypothetical protein